MATNLHDHHSDLLDPDHLAWCCHDSPPASDVKRVVAPMEDGLWETPASASVTDRFAPRFAVSSAVRAERGESQSVVSGNGWDEDCDMSEIADRMDDRFSVAPSVVAEPTGVANPLPAEQSEPFGKDMWSCNSVPHSEVQRETAHAPDVAPVVFSGERANPVERIVTWIGDADSFFESSHTADQAMQPPVVVVSAGLDDSAMGVAEQPPVPLPVTVPQHAAVDAHTMWESGSVGGVASHATLAPDARVGLDNWLSTDAEEKMFDDQLPDGDEVRDGPGFLG
eukprot:GDKI01042894.1.p1 GENE.GDKI01042894.1~~GDKI01042894.1.p1  ORF type:complete len:308 (-),score=51.82 GDKI01042894.1:18-860(-)